ncbi:hypothetical protein [Endozoicomonas elysicola]|uniref:Uncharacterized protein n=1 Tax=Endozoicomonas elysicola TaxID=305900 RepID=A0A081KD35_9GAMM|nr:hypothetical protein [Endozoicomonas elysicola]KEI72061.1 hypothetical protein GV64_16200 [Endozoicomonas elysicola]
MSDVHFDSVNNINYPVNDTSSSELSRRSQVSVIAFSHKCSVVISAASHIGVEAKFVTGSGLGSNASADRKISVESQSIKRTVPASGDDEKIPGYDYPMDLSKKHGAEVGLNSSLLDMNEFDCSCKPERKSPVPRCIEEQKGEQEVSKLLQIRKVPLDLPATSGSGWAKTSFGMGGCGLWGEKRGFPKSVVVEGACNDKRKRHQEIEANYRQRKKEYIKNFDQIINNLKQQCCQAAYQVLECKKYLGSFPAAFSPLTVKIYALDSQEEINVFFDSYVASVQERFERDKEARILKERAEKGSPIVVEGGGSIIDSNVRHKLTQRNYRVRTAFDYQMKKKIESEINSDLQKILNDVATFGKWRNQWVSTPKFGVD